MKTVRTCNSLVEAESCKFLLAEFKIESVLLDTEMFGLLPSSNMFLGGVRIAVLDETLVEKAKKILKESFDENQSDENQEKIEGEE